jgi:hypothetical protein
LKFQASSLDEGASMMQSKPGSDKRSWLSATAILLECDDPTAKRHKAKQFPGTFLHQSLHLPLSGTGRLAVATACRLAPNATQPSFQLRGIDNAKAVS